MKSDLESEDAAVLRANRLHLTSTDCRTDAAPRPEQPIPTAGKPQMSKTTFTQGLAPQLPVCMIHDTPSNQGHCDVLAVSETSGVVLPLLDVML